MRAVVEGRELVLDAVARPVLRASDAADVVVRERARPHDVRAGGIVHRVAQDGRALGDDRAHEGFAEFVRHQHVARRREIALDDVGKDVHEAAGRLVGRKGEGELGVHHGEARTQPVAGDGALEVVRLQADDAVARSLAAGGGEGEDDADGERGGDDRRLLAVLAEGEVAEVAVVEGAEGDGLRRVDDAAAADGEDEVDLLAADEIDALADEGFARVRLHAAEGDEGDARLLQRLHDLVVDAVSLDAPAAEVQQRLGPAKCLHEGAGPLLGSPAKREMRRRLKFKVIHAVDYTKTSRRGCGAVFSTGLTGWAGFRAGLGAARDHGSGWRRGVAPAHGGPMADSRASTPPPTATPLRCVASPPPDTETRFAGHRIPRKMA